MARVKKSSLQPFIPHAPLIPHLTAVATVGEVASGEDDVTDGEMRCSMSP